MSHRIGVVMVCIGLLACSGCSSDANLPPGGTVPGETYEYFFERLDGSPLEGARIAVDTADGRREAVADASGHAVVSGVIGDINALTVDADGYIVQSWSRPKALERFRELTGDPPAIPMFPIEPFSPSETVVLSGTTQNAIGAELLVAVDVAGEVSSVSFAPGPTWSVEVLAGRALDIFALDVDSTSVGRSTNLELHAAWRASLPAVTRDTTLEIDFSEAVATESASGSFPLPDYAPLSTQGVGTVTVAALGRQNATILGLSTRTEISSDGQSVDYDVSYIVAPDREIFTSYETAVQGRQRSRSAVVGAPTSGVQEVAPLSWAIIESDGVIPLPLREPIHWTYAGAVHPELLAIGIADVDGRNIGAYFVDADGATATLPQPPTSEAGSPFHPGPIIAVPVACDETLGKATLLCTRTALGEEDFVLAP